MIFPRISDSMSRKKKAGLNLNLNQKQAVIWAASGIKTSKNGSVRNHMKADLSFPRMFLNFQFRDRTLLLREMR